MNGPLASEMAQALGGGLVGVLPAQSATTDSGWAKVVGRNIFFFQVRPVAHACHGPSFFGVPIGLGNGVSDGGRLMGGVLRPWNFEPRLASQLPTRLSDHVVSRISRPSLIPRRRYLRYFTALVQVPQAFWWRSEKVGSSIHFPPWAFQLPTTRAPCVGRHQAPFHARLAQLPLRQLHCSDGIDPLEIAAARCVSLGQMSPVRCIVVASASCPSFISQRLNHSQTSQCRSEVRPTQLAVHRAQFNQLKWKVPSADI